MKMTTITTLAANIKNPQSGLRYIAGFLEQALPGLDEKAQNEITKAFKNAERHYGEETA